jgi:hypothetical protein
MHTYRRRKETLGVLGEHALRHKSVYISVNYNTNFKFLKTLFIFTIWKGLSQKTITRYCPFKDGPPNCINRSRPREQTQLITNSALHA